MFKNYFRIAIRSLLKQKAYSVINILGLAVGIASCLLIMLFVNDEFSYDKFHSNSDRLYKFVLERKYPNHSTNYAVVPHSFGDVMPKDFPEVEKVVRMSGNINDQIVTHRTDEGELVQFEEDFLQAAEANFFEVFNIKLLKGDAKTVLLNLTDLVITEATAKRYFGEEDPIGKKFQIFGGQDFSVTGVCENVPENSHFAFDFLLHWDPQNFGGRGEVFTSFSAHMYLLLKPGSDAKALEAKFPQMVDTYASAQIERDLGKSWEDYKKEGNGYRYFLQPIESIHLDPLNIEYKMKPVGGNLNQIYFLICVAVLVVLIACINFMNLATARSAERAREVGVRKTMGSMKSQLIYQFLIESIMITLIATVLALVIVQLAMPGFNALTHKELSIPLSPLLGAALLGLAIFVGLLAGSYPAFVLSAFNPVVVMKGNFAANSKGAWLRNGLVVFQFMISIVLIVGTLVVSDQMRYMANVSLGYDKEKVMIVERAFQARNKIETFKDELEGIPGVKAAASTTSKLGNNNDFFGAQYQPEGSTEILTTKNFFMDDRLADAIGFEFVQGHGFVRETNDSLSIILNETAVKTMELGDNPIGKRLNHVQRNQDGNVTLTYTIIGVIKDFNFQSLRDKITPITIRSTETFGGGGQYVYLKLDTDDVNAVIKAAEERWKNVVSLTRQPGEAAEQPFKYSFLDQDLEANYEAEKRAGTLFTIFSTLAIVIACVGLFGLAAYTANLRTKEIGVRKVLGASVSSVLILLTSDFTKLIAIAFVLAAPLAWYIMDSWLQEFAFRTTLGPGTFLLAGSLAILISWLTVSYQSVKAALKNPVNSLRSE
jgi:putative ABC transport system permease protein